MAGDLRSGAGGKTLKLELSPHKFDEAAARLAAWLETMRSSDGLQGYGGPVAHWWQQSLLYTGPGYDWRYEGILLGYLALWQRTGEPRWLESARRAGDDLVQAQLADGHYPTSAFELNPASGGTPHEAAADLGLLALAQCLRQIGDPAWERYAESAARNLRTYYIEKLWDSETRSFRDHPQISCFVPNKAATACQAFIAWSKLIGDDHWASQFGLPNLDRILAHQVMEPGPLRGAIAQNSFGRRVVEKYMPYYIARCVPALVEGYELSGEEKYLAAALAAMDFIFRQVHDDGWLPAAVYPKGQVNQYPAWIAGLGDVLRAAGMVLPFGFAADLSSFEDRLLTGQDSSGGIQTASGFSAQAGERAGSLPDVRDLLHIAGWCDKAFRYLAGRVSGTALPLARSEYFEAECVFRGRRMRLVETAEKVEIEENHEVVYLWVKGEQWARAADPVFWLH